MIQEFVRRFSVSLVNPGKHWHALDCIKCTPDLPLPVPKRSSCSEPQLCKDFLSCTTSADTCVCDVVIKLTPTIASFSIPLLESFFDRFLRILTLSWLLERVIAHRPLERFELEHVPRGKEMGIVDDLDERFDFRTFGYLLFAHGFSHFQWISMRRERSSAEMKARTNMLSRDGRKFVETGGARVGGNDASAPCGERATGMRTNLSIPATIAWGYGRSLVPSSRC